MQVSFIWDIFSSQETTERAPPCLPGGVEVAIFFNCVFELCFCALCARFWIYIPQGAFHEKPGGCKIFDHVYANHVAVFASAESKSAPQRVSFFFVHPATLIIEFPVSNALLSLLLLARGKQLWPRHNTTKTIIRRE